MKDMFWWVIGGAALILVSILARPKKKKRKRRKRKRKTSRASKSNRKKRSYTGSRIKKEAGLTTKKTYKEMNPRQKSLFNLAKARLERKKKSKKR